MQSIGMRKAFQQHQSQSHNIGKQDEVKKKNPKSKCGAFIYADKRWPVKQGGKVSRNITGIIKLHMRTFNANDKIKSGPSLG